MNTKECDANRFFAGEVEPCIKGQVAAVGAYFGQDELSIAGRLLSEQLPDGDGKNAGEMPVKVDDGGAQPSR